MLFQNLFILNCTIFSLFQIYIIFKYAKRKQVGKIFENLTVYLVVMAFLYYENYYNLNIPDIIITCSLLTVLGHSFIGDYLRFYYKSKIYDRYLHLFGSFSFALLAFSIINYKSPLVNESNIHIFLFVMSLGITIGVFFEIIEFIHDSFSKKIMCQHGLADTDFDMIFNIFGSVIAGFATIYFYPTFYLM